MTGAVIAQLIIALGPTALKLINDLISVWSTQLTPEQVLAITAKAQKNYDEYIAEARASLTPPIATPPQP